MSGGGEIIIRNGTFKQWLNYYVVLGGKVSQNDEYGVIEGGLRVKGVWFVGLAALIGIFAGALVG